MRIPIWLFIILVVFAALFVLELLMFIISGIVASKHYDEQLKEFDDYVQEKSEE